MNRRTAGALREINRSFYRAHAADFAATRAAPWPGWERLLPHLDATLSHSPTVRIVDLGRGNGRFGLWLGRAWRQDVRLLGVDLSPVLLRTVVPGESRACLDLCGELPLRPASFDFAALLGVLHHIPGHDTRRSLLRRAADLLRPGGRLAVTFWRPEPTRLLRRALGPPHLPPGIAKEDLDPGDLLLPWGAEPSRTSLRYCHISDAGEQALLEVSSGLRCVDRFWDDGGPNGCNAYFVGERTG